MSALTIKALTFGYDKTPVLADLDLDLEPGLITAVIGPSGCGKTTLLRLLAGFERPAQGTISFDGDIVAGPGTFLTPDKRNVGIVPQEGALFPHLSVADNVGFGLPKRLGRRRTDRIAELLTLIDLADYGERYPRQLSGGQQQRVALARALAPRPGVVLLDEPFASLDPSTRLAVRRSVREVIRAESATALIVTHDRDEALSLADCVVVMLGGSVAQVGSPETVYDQPVTAEVANLLGEANTLEVFERHAGRVSTALGVLPVGSGEGPMALVRPERMSLNHEDGVAARVISCDFVGSSTRLLARVEEGVGAGTEVVATVVQHRPHFGDAVRLGVNQAVHLLG